MTRAVCPHDRWVEVFSYTTDFHDRYSVVQCASCDGMFLFNTWEHVDWEDGRDRQGSHLEPLSLDEVDEHRRRAARWGSE